MDNLHSFDFQKDIPGACFECLSRETLKTQCLEGQVLILQVQKIFGGAGRQMLLNANDDSGLWVWAHWYYHSFLNTNFSKFTPLWILSILKSTFIRCTWLHWPLTVSSAWLLWLSMVSCPWLHRGSFISSACFTSKALLYR